jgi:hypothetical protein
MEQLLNIALVSPFFLTLVIFTVAIVFAPAVKNEIAPATAHDHEEMDHAYSSSPEMVAVLASGLGSERGDRMDEDQYEIEKIGSIHLRDLTKSEGVVVDEQDSSDPTCVINPAHLLTTRLAYEACLIELTRAFLTARRARLSSTFASHR